MKQEIRLYNVIFPIWFLFLFPQVWLIVLPANLVIDCLVLLVCLTILKHRSKGAVVKELWKPFWLRGFLSDFVGVAVLLPSLFLGIALSSAADLPWVVWLEEHLSPVLYNPFRSPLAFLWTLLAVGVAGYCIYRFDRKAMASCVLLSEREREFIARAMAVVTAPWLFFIPMY